LNEIKYDYVDSKQHFYLQYHAAATDMKALRKKINDTSSSGVPWFPAPSGDYRMKKVGGPLRGQGKIRGGNINIYLAW